ncbi:sulfite exporter TauE/SafE family protein [Patescibacteria group bacterium]|nr:sulfite exporter TauE/SafE family protein [Patescibacteria group bacterium]
MLEIILIALLTILASGVGTLSGFGSSTIMVPVLLLFFPFTETLLLAGILHLFNDIWKLTLFKKGIRWRLIFSFGIPGVIATYLGASLIFQAPEDLLSRILGGFLILYALYLLANPRFKIKAGLTSAAVGGALSGFFAGIFGLGGAIRSAFLAAFNLPKTVYIATAGGIALVIDTTRVTTYFIEGVQLRYLLMIGLLVFIPASFLGAKIAQRLVKRIPQKNFRLVIAVFLLVAGAKFFLFPA